MGECCEKTAGEWADNRDDDKTERSTGRGRRTWEKIRVGNQMTALRFREMGKHTWPTFRVDFTNSCYTFTFTRHKSACIRYDYIGPVYVHMLANCALHIACYNRVRQVELAFFPSKSGDNSPGISFSSWNLCASSLPSC